MLKSARRVFSFTSIIIIVILFSSNIALLSSERVYRYASSFFHRAISTLLPEHRTPNRPRVPSSANKQLLEKRIDSQKRELEKNKKLAKKIGSRIYKRTAVDAARNISSATIEAIPYIGTAVVLSVTMMELKDACDTMKDIDNLVSGISGENAATVPKEEEKYCGITKDELLAMLNSKTKREAGCKKLKTDMPELSCKDLPSLPSVDSLPGTPPKSRPRDPTQ